ncbi:MAG: hydroxymethylbilane synthase [Ignavibacteria bacterium]|nr:hydroxymethylbilane synthase [Ignavibacteria bacterium]
MSDKTKIIIGSRGSALALWQSNFIKKEIENANPDVEIEIQLIKTMGDNILDVPLAKIGDKGLFTKELENELLAGNIDIAVHSLKDLPTDLPKGLKLAAVTKRHNCEDVLITKNAGTAIETLPQGATVGTGSLRRKCQIKSIRPDLNVVDLRGNVPTRIKKFLQSDWEAIILARAGVERLNMEKYISSVISVDQILPAVGQGALGIEIKKTNKAVEKILKSIHDDETFAAVTAERAFLKALDGGCQVPIGAYAQVRPTGLFMEGLVGSIEGDKIFRSKMRGSKKEAEKLGKNLAEELLNAGAKEILSEIYNPVPSEKSV